MDSHSQQAMVTGSSVVAVVFDGGVAMAADTLGSYGKMARYKDISRLYPVNNRTLLGFSGDLADFQYLKPIVEQKQIEIENFDPKASLSPKALHSWLTAVLYNRRSKFDPLLNTYVVGGITSEKTPYLGYVDKLGVAYTENFISTGIAVYLVQAALEAEVSKARVPGRPFGREEAIQLLRNCMELLFHRDCLASNEYEIGIITERGCEIVKQDKIGGRWELATDVKGYE